MNRPLKITLWIHRESDIKNTRASISEFQKYLDDAVAFFKPLSIEIDCKQRPSMETGIKWNNLLWHVDEQARLKKENNSERRNVSLVLAKSHTPLDTSINGLLFDTENRSIAVLFTEAMAFKGTEEQTFQVLIHELGHVLNLVHEDSLNPSKVTNAIGSAMNQEEERPNDRSQLLENWHCTLTQNIYDTRDIDGLKQFFNKQKHDGNLLGLPFSPTSVNFLRRHLPLEDILPWGNPFRDISVESHLDWGDPGLRSHILFERDDFGVGEPLDFQIEIENLSTSNRYHIPAHLGMKFGNISLSILNPEGTLHAFNSKTKICAEGKRILNPGEKMARSFSLLSAGKGVLLSKPGEYVVEASFPCLPIYKVSASLTVLPARVKALADHNFQRFLGSGHSSRSQRSWRMIEELITATDMIPSGAKNHFCLLYTIRRPRALLSDELFLSCLENREGARIHEKALMMAADPTQLPKQWRGYDSDRIREEAFQCFTSLDSEYPIPINLIPKLTKEVK